MARYASQIDTKKDGRAVEIPALRSETRDRCQTRSYRPRLDIDDGRHGREARSGISHYPRGARSVCTPQPSTRRGRLEIEPTRRRSDGGLSRSRFQADHNGHWFSRGTEHRSIGEDATVL